MAKEKKPPKKRAKKEKQAPEESKSKGGRPESITPEIAEEIFLKMVEGRTLRQIERLPGMPSKTTILRWSVSTDPEKKWFCDQYARARELQCYLRAEEMVEIADDSSNDWMDVEVADGIFEKRPDHEHINRSRERISIRKWLLSKILPKEFGDKVELNHKGDLSVSVTVAGYDNGVKS